MTKQKQSVVVRLEILSNAYHLFLSFNCGGLNPLFDIRKSALEKTTFTKVNLLTLVNHSVTHMCNFMLNDISTAFQAYTVFLCVNATTKAWAQTHNLQNRGPTTNSYTVSTNIFSEEKNLTQVKLIY